MEYIVFYKTCKVFDNRNDLLDKQLLFRKILEASIEASFFSSKQKPQLNLIVGSIKYLHSLLLIFFNYTLEKFKKKIAFQKNAVVYTFSPFKLKTFLKQLIRWQKGVYKEILQSSRDNKKGNRLLFFDMWYGLFTSLIIKFIVLFFIIYLTITNIQYLLIYITITGFWIIGVGALYNLYTLFEDKKDFFYSFLWTVGYETIFWITTIPALLGIRNQTTWGTR